MTVQIAESGWLCLLGGVVIGALRLETGDLAYRLIPVDCFQGEAYVRKAYLQEAENLTAELMSGLDVPKRSELIHICSGVIGGHVRETLRKQGYQVRAIQQAKELQLLTDTTLVQHLHQDIGFRGLDYETFIAKPGLAFWLCLQWLKGGNVNASRVIPAREGFAKTGWSTYPLWAEHPYQEAKVLVRQRRALS